MDHDGWAVDNAVLSPDGLTVMTDGSDGTVRLWDSLTGKQRAVLGEPFPARPGNAALSDSGFQFSSDGRTALTRHIGEKNVDDRTIRLWDAASGHLQAETAKLLGKNLGLGSATMHRG